MAIEEIESRGVRLTFIPKGTRPFSRGILRRNPDFFGDILVVTERGFDRPALEYVAGKYGKSTFEVEQALIRMVHTTRIHNRKVIDSGIREALLR